MKPQRVFTSSSPNVNRVLVHIIFVVVALALSDFFAQHRFSANVARGELPTAISPLDFKASCAQAADCDTPVIHAPPFQYGAMIPWIVDVLKYSGGQLAPLYGVPPTPGFHYLEVFSVLILFIVFRYYVSQFFVRDVTSSVLCIFLFYSLVSLFILPRIVPLTYAIWFPWDVPSICLFTICLVLLHRRIWLFYYLLFALAVLTKQTAIFLAVVYLFTSMGHVKSRTVAVHFSLQVAIWLVIVYGQYHVGGGNPFTMGLFGLSNLQRNLVFLGRITNLPFLFSVFGYLWIPAVVFLPVIRDSFVRRSMWVTVPYFLTVMLVGDVSELRIYGELAPVVLVAFFHVLKELSRQAVPTVSDK